MIRLASLALTVLRRKKFTKDGFSKVDVRGSLHLKLVKNKENYDGTLKVNKTHVKTQLNLMIDTSLSNCNSGESNTSHLSFNHIIVDFEVNATPSNTSSVPSPPECLQKQGDLGQGLCGLHQVKMVWLGENGALRLTIYLIHMCVSIRDQHQAIASTTTSATTKAANAMAAMMDADVVYRHLLLLLPLL